MSSFVKNKRMTLTKIRAKQTSNEKISMVTCYDASFARLIDKTKIDMILVGDSLGNVMLGYQDTIRVTLNDVLHHCKAVSRVSGRPFICADMPFMTYQVSVENALENAARLMQEGGAHGVKVEGGGPVLEKITAITEAGIPVMGHIGLTPQSIHQLGGYRVQGRGQAGQALLDEAKRIEDAGAFALVLEMVPYEVAEKITSELTIPTIGIGAGPRCSGQVLVLQDLLGFDADFSPKFLKKYLDLGTMVCEALDAFDSEVKNGIFPSIEKHSFADSKE
ncbi:MAG: 3-methyl-2-oxobutanoate hydroxymethyltransferase [Bdellovibrionota bacterium]